MSVIVSLYNYEGHIEAALDSVARGAVPRLRADRRRRRLHRRLARPRAGWAGRHPDVTALLLRHPSNRGLPARATRRSTSRAASSRCPRRRQRALPALPRAAGRGARRRPGGGLRLRDPRAASTTTGPNGLLGVGGWDPGGCARCNHIDALALVRRERCASSSGYTDGRAASTAGRTTTCGAGSPSAAAGHAVKEIVGRYRAPRARCSPRHQPLHHEAYAALVERHPRLMAGVTPPL